MGEGESVRNMVMMTIKSAETGLVPAIASVVVWENLRSLVSLFPGE